MVFFVVLTFRDFMIKNLFLSRMPKLFQYYPIQFFADSETDVDELRAISLSCLGSEGLFDPFKAFHAFGVVRDKCFQGRIHEGDHLPEGIRKIVWTPSKLIGIVKTVRYEFSCG